MSRMLQGLLSNGNEMRRCPNCDATIGVEAMNIQEGVALCSGCGELSRLSQLNWNRRSMAETLAKPPKGCRLVEDGQRVVVTVSMRSWQGLFVAAGISLFWNGILSIFVLIAIGGLYSNWVGPLPDWYPVPGLKEGKPEMNGAPMDLGTTYFLCIFLIPFLLVGAGMLGAMVLQWIGKVEVVLDELDSFVATGTSWACWKKRFDPQQVVAIEYRAKALQSDGEEKRVLHLMADRTVVFGSMLSPDQLEWLRVVLRAMLLPRREEWQRGFVPELGWLRRV